MKYAIDANIIVYAVAHHLKMQGKYPARYVASARVFARRRRVRIIIPSCFLGEAIQGAGADQQLLDMVVALCVKGTAVIADPRRQTFADSVMLRRQLRRGDSSRIDCLGYAISAQEKCDRFVSYDKGFIGGDNRQRVPLAYRQVCNGLHAPDCFTSEDIMTQKINPKRRRRTSERKDPLLVAWERRANAAARAAGARTDLEVARFFCGTARAFVEEYGRG